MPILDTIARFFKGVNTLGKSVTLQACIYPFRKAYYSAKFADVRGAKRAKGSSLRGMVAAIATLCGWLRRGASATFTSKTPAQDAATSEPYTFPGRVLAHQWHSAAKGLKKQRIDLTCENALVQITVLAPDLIRVHASPSGRFGHPAERLTPLRERARFSYAVARRPCSQGDKEWQPVEFSVEETADNLIIHTSRLCCRIAKAHFSVTFLDPDGEVINADAGGVAWQGKGERVRRVVCRKHLPPDEHIYGLGQKTTSLDKRGLAFQMWNTDPQTYNPGDDPIYSSIPFYLGLKGGRGYGIFFDNSCRGKFDFGAQTSGITHFEAECGEMCYYFFYGPQLTTVLDRYTELTGRLIMPPLWALGYHQNRWSYFPEARVREIAREFRKRHIPCEAIHLDIDYMDGFRCFTWHPGRFPDPASLIDDLHADGYKVVVMIDPGIKTDPNYWVYKEGLEKDVFCKYPDGKPYNGPVWPGKCYFPDFTSLRVRAWWGELYRGMTDLGVDGFWNDMNEPAVFGHAGDTFPDAVQHEWEGYGTDHREAHNVYGMQMARATAEGLMKLRPNERPFVISRSVWAGTQRYNMHWLGDNRSDWASLRNTMQLVMNMGLSGIAFTGPDTGGLSGTPDGELLIRWNQLGVFTPFFRNHTAKGTEDQEPWAFGETCERISRKFIELRYHLLPYHYTAFWQSAQNGTPMMRPLFLAFQKDPHVVSIDDEFMFGDAFLVAPIVEPANVGKSASRQVYIPQGLWYDFWQNTITAGPQTVRLKAPLDRIPLLVRAGSIIPAWPAMQYTGERSERFAIDGEHVALILHVYPGNGESLLYEDDGHTWAFKKGNYRITCLICETRWAAGSYHPTFLKIKRALKGPFTPTYETNELVRIQVNIHGISSAPRTLFADGKPVTNAQFDPQICTLTFETDLFHTIKAQFAEEKEKGDKG